MLYDKILQVSFYFALFLVAVVEMRVEAHNKWFIPRWNDQMISSFTYTPFVIYTHFIPRPPLSIVFVRNK